MGSTASPCSPSGETCLHQAAALGQRTICHYIVEAGASLMKTDQQVREGQGGHGGIHADTEPPFPELRPWERGAWGRAASGDSELAFNTARTPNLRSQKAASPEGSALLSSLLGPTGS